MKGPLACLIAAVLCLGCQAPPGAIDPFIGRQTVPPPGTGTPAAIPPGDSYYNAAPKTSATTNSSGPSNSPYEPKGGFEFQGKGTNVANRSGATITNGTGSNRYSPPSQGGAPSTTPASRDTNIPRTDAGSSQVRPASPADIFPGSTTSRSTPSSSFQVNSNPSRGLQTTTASTRTSALPGVPRQPTPAQPARDIMNLPDARPSTSPGSSGGFRPPGTATRATYEEEVKEIKDSSKTTSRAPRRETVAGGKYEADRNFRSLKGKLEYSRIDDRWKLRYIPIDGDTDDYGGSVVLLGSRLLEGYKPGEYVTVYGTLGETDSRGAGFAPTYTVDRVTRQSEE